MSVPTYAIRSGVVSYRGTHPEAAAPVATPAWRWNQPATRDVLVWGEEPARIVGNRNLTSHMQRILDRPDEWPSAEITILRLAP